MWHLLLRMRMDYVHAPHTKLITNAYTKYTTRKHSPTQVVYGARLVYLWIEISGCSYYTLMWIEKT